MVGSRIFTFRPVLTFFALISLIILVSLGTWQLNRLAWKRDLIAQVEQLSTQAPTPIADAVANEETFAEYQRVEVRGEYVPDGEVHVFGAIEGKAGVIVFTPMKILAGDLLYINRGFVDQSLHKAGQFSPPPKGEQTVTGLLRAPEAPRPPAAWFVSREMGADGLWFIRDPSLFADAAGIEAFSYYIDADARAGQDWPKGGTTRLDFRNKHLEYALTWFGLAGTLMAIWLAMSFPSRR